MEHHSLIFFLYYIEEISKKKFLLLRIETKQLILPELSLSTYYVRTTSFDVAYVVGGWVGGSAVH